MTAPYSFSRRLIWYFIAGGAAACVFTIVLVAAASSAMGASMSFHGWAALTFGTIVSYALALSLSALLVWSRRNGFDEAADQAARSTEKRN
ncbi:MAG: hypothetical protein AAFQ67_09135 [Pseudomonadota bacterium]